MSFVVIQHLAPDHQSALADILSSSTKMPVQQLTSPTAIKINSIYVCAPDSVVIMKERNLIPMTTPETGVHRLPIDYFLRSLAVELQENAVGILLSGAGSDGTLGLQTIKRFGGLTLVQTPDSARFDAMPKSAIGAGVVDYALTIDEMASQIVSYFAFRSQNAAGTGSEDELMACLPAIFKMLHEALGHDFSRYKQTTLIRRIRRRMQMLRIKPAQAYADVLGKDPKEAQELFRDLIIGVTEFFRDTETFELLGRQVIPKLFQNLDARGGGLFHGHPST
jgi:two-component system CheB/CheR fusion protein